MSKQLHHSPPSPSRLRTHFQAPGSPLHGRRVPMDWAVLDFGGKARALVANGYAADWQAACRLLGQHSAAIRQARKARTGGATAPDDLRRQQKARRWWDR